MTSRAEVTDDRGQIPAGSVFELTFRRGEERVVLECDASHVDLVWDRVMEWGSAPLVADDHSRLAQILKRYPPPKPR